MTRLSHDIWHLVVQHLDAQEDFCSLALVSKSLYSLAISRLYSTILIGPKPRTMLDLYPEFNGGRQKKSKSAQLKDFRSLIGRLTENPDGLQARSVREIEVQDFDIRDEDVALDFEQALTKLVVTLSNLRQFRLRTSTPEFKNLLRGLNGHGSKPELHLLREDGSRVVQGPMLSVATIHAQMNPYYDTPEKPNRQYLGLQELFFACHNLKSFSITEGGNYGGCVRHMPNHPRIYSFQLKGTEAFPPLESLSLDGYSMGDWVHWRDNINWSILKSLSLGPQPNTHLLKCFRAYAKHLKSLKVKTYAGEGKDSCPELENMLLSFNTLERLVVRGHFVSNRALTKHSKLRELCLHTIELKRRLGAPRPTLDVADLYELDAKCPDLETLELDINRSNEWPADIMKALASGFSNLRHLTLHCEVGIDWDNGVRRGVGGGPRSREPLLPRLDEDLAKAFGEAFFSWRPQSRLKTVTLKTGEDLRRFPQWPPAYKEDERRWSRTIHIIAPSSLREGLTIETEIHRGWF